MFHLHWEPRAVLAGIRFANLSARGAIASCMKCFALRDAEHIRPIPPALQATRMRRAFARVAGGIDAKRESSCSERLTQMPEQP